jgi:hypothetical protein
MSLVDEINVLVKAIIVVERVGFFSFKNYSLVIGSSETSHFFIVFFIIRLKSQATSLYST